MRRAFLAAMACLLAAPASAQVLTEWVESNPTGATNRIALGYPVPMPVDTPLPFDGFRSYAGLHARHQDLALTTPWVHPAGIGNTRLGRTIWAYRLGDDDLVTPYGLPEPATLTNGGIHAREWQSPEVVTGIMELIATHDDDDYFYDYLRDHVNMVVIPSLNIDGFLQTQAYPSSNYLGVDDSYPNSSPRDGRMRRKNLRDADESLATQSDLLNGVDLNRNNNPFWRTSSGSSSYPGSLVYHGPSPASEPETRALDAAAQLGPASQLRIYTDVHSFSQVHFWVRSPNDRLTAQTGLVLNTFTEHHRAFPAGKWYAFADAYDMPVNRGIGSTDEYFTYTYQVPAWTLEIEPTNGQNFHAPLPGCGADYGGEANNCHDGFILPEAEIRRVREQLAQSFAAVYYRQAGPPSIRALRVIDSATGAVVHEAEWDVEDDLSRSLFENPLQELQLGRAYRLWIAFDKPMRWRENGEVKVFPGQASNRLVILVRPFAGDIRLDEEVTDEGWLNEGWEAPGGYLRYRDDAYFVDFTLPDTPEHRAAVDASSLINLKILTFDMTGMQLDADPSTVASWSGGAWTRYENASGVAGDSGGQDTTLFVGATSQSLPELQLVEPGMAGAWYDRDRSGEGFIIEMLADDQVVMYWFTYDDEGGQDWYIAVGEARGNRIVFPEVLSVSGGEFGPGFDPTLVTETPVGTARFTWSSCRDATMDWHIGNRTGRQNLSRLTFVMGMECGQPRMAPTLEQALYSGSWYDPSHSGEGYTLEVLANGLTLVFWFSYDSKGHRRWFFGVGEISDGKLVFDEMLTTVGGVFGDELDSELIDEVPWGTLELELSCDGGTATYTSSEEGFGSGRLDLQRLTQFDGLECP